jgi:hypothetical protein
LERALLGRNNQDKTAWQAIPCPDLKLPKRYEGALLFGQLVPRFDNRIISTCPISGQKVPSRNCPEFLNFRWAMQLANIRAARFGEKELSPLTKPERKQLDALMRAQGGMGVEEFKKHVRQVSGAIRDNLETMFMHPDAKEALLLDPVTKLIQSNEVQPFWALLPERLQKRARGQWRRGKSISLSKLREQLSGLGGDTASFDAQVSRQLDAVNTRGRKKDNPSANGLKFFSTAEVVEMGKDRAWLAKMTQTVSQRWRRRNYRQKPYKEKIADEEGCIASASECLRSGNQCESPCKSHHGT